MKELFKAIGKRAMGPHTAANIRGAADKFVQEVEPEEETGDSNDMLNTLPTKVKDFEGGSGRLKKKSATKSLVESIKCWSKSQATKNEAYVRAQEEFCHYIVEKRACLAIAHSCANDEDNIPASMGMLNAIEGLEDKVYALAMQELAMKKEMRLAFVNVPP